MPFVKIKNCLNCGIPHEWLFEGPTLKELRVIKVLTGQSGKEYMESADSGDPDSLAALLYILHLRDKISVPFDDIDLDFTDFDMVETEQEKKERELLEKEAKKEADKLAMKNGLTLKVASQRKSAAMP